MNGILPVVLADLEVAAIRRNLHENVGGKLSVDLPTQTVTDVTGEVYRFDIHPIRKNCLLEGLDEIARTQRYSNRMAEFEVQHQKHLYWVFASKGSEKTL